MRGVGGEATGAVVLIVDDDQETRELVRDALEPLGYDVWEAVNGADALALIEERGSGANGGPRPAAILLDLHTPGMDGWRFAYEYGQREQPRAAVIAFTASRLPGPVVGTVATIRKPFDLRELVETVSRFAPAPSGEDR